MSQDVILHLFNAIFPCTLLNPNKRASTGIQHWIEWIDFCHTFYTLFVCDDAQFTWSMCDRRGPGVSCRWYKQKLQPRGCFLPRSRSRSRSSRTGGPVVAGPVVPANSNKSSYLRNQHSLKPSTVSPTLSR